MKRPNTYESLKATLEQTLTFPTMYVFKFIVPAAQLNHLLALVDGLPYTLRDSRTGKYTGVTIETVANQAGLRFRPLVVTAREMLDRFVAEPEELRAQLQPNLERDAGLLAEWKSRSLAWLGGTSSSATTAAAGRLPTTRRLSASGSRHQGRGGMRTGSPRSGITPKSPSSASSAGMLAARSALMRSATGGSASQARSIRYI